MGLGEIKVKLREDEGRGKIVRYFRIVFVFLCSGFRKVVRGVCV